MSHGKGIACECTGLIQCLVQSYPFSFLFSRLILYNHPCDCSKSTFIYPLRCAKHMHKVSDWYVEKWDRNAWAYTREWAEDTFHKQYGEKQSSL